MISGKDLFFSHIFTNSSFVLFFFVVFVNFQLFPCEIFRLTLNYSKTPTLNIVSFIVLRHIISSISFTHAEASANTGTGRASRCVSAVSVWTTASVVHSTLIYICGNNVPPQTSVLWLHVKQNYFKITSEAYCSSWIISSMFSVAEIILK